jgi:hypothetical protein
MNSSLTKPTPPLGIAERLNASFGFPMFIILCARGLESCSRGKTFMHGGSEESRQSIWDGNDPMEHD